jgi:hypothetical protein
MYFSIYMTPRSNCDLTEQFGNHKHVSSFGLDMMPRAWSGKVRNLWDVSLLHRAGRTPP